MSLSTLPLSYCTNVHPGITVDAVLAGLQEHTVEAARIFGKRLAAGLWLSSPVINELNSSNGGIERLQAVLADNQLICYTLNSFPFGDFHSERVKEQVYLPDWSNPERLKYTTQCASVLAQLMPVGVEGSLSTVPLGFKERQYPADFRQQCIAQLLELARFLDDMHDESGQVIRLAIEPEPCCVLETTPETLAFFDQLFAAAESAGLLDAVQRHVGVCYDICHQAVEFEDIPESIRQLAAAEIRINKVHITCAVELNCVQGNELGRKQLEGFVEPRYLHQVFAKQKTGGIVSVTDLTKELCERPSAEFEQASDWRIHFHVPVHIEELGALRTTRHELKPALQAVSDLVYAPHLEVETYTWGVSPGQSPMPLADGIAKELTATDHLLAEIRSSL
ncbi:metabolite traffic protein EboE [Planctomicrobium sp. SH527]|uniref:metabolite traffic protein EboE n=1 Tax=Planctomicrobium sp. SH527 TaxID=3448123 RepID=UPI003F5C1AA8